MKRIAHPRTAGAVLALVVAVCVLFSTVSNAAGLQLVAHSGGVFAQTTARCTDGPLPVEPTDTADANGEHSVITVSGPMGSCTGGEVLVYLTDSPHTIEFSASGTVSDGELVVTSDPFKPLEVGHSVVVRLNGWIIPATWKYTAPEPEPEPEPEGPVTPGDNIEIVGGAPSWNFSGSKGNLYCFVATIRGTSPVPQPWTLDLHVNERPFNGEQSADALHLNTNGVEWVTEAAVAGILQIRGASNNGSDRRHISSSDQFTVTVCDYEAPLPAYDESLTYTTTVGAITGGSGNACMPVSVTVSGTPQFYAGWRADLDLTSLLASIAKPNPTVRASDGRTVTHLAGKTYRISGDSWNHGTIRDDDPQIFEVCAS